MHRTRHTIPTAHTGRLTCTPSTNLIYYTSHNTRRTHRTAHRTLPSAQHMHTILKPLASVPPTTHRQPHRNTAPSRRTPATTHRRHNSSPQHIAAHYAVTL